MVQRGVVMKKRQLISSLLCIILSLGCSASFAGFPFFSTQDEQPTLAPMLKKTLPAVVNISTTSSVKTQANRLLNDPLFKEFFDYFKEFQWPELPSGQFGQSIGSGVIVDADKGYILTNHHVIDAADKIYITLKDGRKLNAQLVGSDKETDLAVLKVEAKDLTALPLGDSDKIEVGDFVVAIGNPFGLGHTVTSGIVSAVGRSGLGLKGYEDYIQTDASINPGNSGGALLSWGGELIGLNTAIVSTSGANVGIGFATPVNMAKQVMKQLIEHGEVKRGQIGVSIQDMTPELARAMDLKIEHGALISKVVPNSPAASARLQEGDVIVEMDGQKVKSASVLKNIIGTKNINEKIKITAIRQGKMYTTEMTIVAPVETLVKTELPLLKGATFQAMGADHPLYHEVKGVVVSHVKFGSSAWRAGLRTNDVIVSVNRRPVSTPKEIMEAVESKSGGILMNVRRAETALFIVIK